MTKLYAAIASRLEAMRNCEKTGNQEWLERHRADIEKICDEHMPHGSGLDGEPVALDFDRSTPNKLVFVNVDFHHMDEGFYSGWTEHEITVTPNLAHGFDMKISGKDRNDIKEYLAEMFYEVLGRDIEV